MSKNASIGIILFITGLMFGIMGTRHYYVDGGKYCNPFRTETKEKSGGLEKAMLSDVKGITLLDSPKHFRYSTGHFKVDKVISPHLALMNEYERSPLGMEYLTGPTIAYYNEDESFYTGQEIIFPAGSKLSDIARYRQDGSNLFPVITLKNN